MILSEKNAVSSLQNISKLLAKIFLTIHLESVSLINPNSIGTISLNNNLP